MPMLMCLMLSHRSHRLCYAFLYFFSLLTPPTWSFQVSSLKVCCFCLLPANMYCWTPLVNFYFSYCIFQIQKLFFSLSLFLFIDILILFIHCLLVFFPSLSMVLLLLFVCSLSIKKVVLKSLFSKSNF